MSDKKLQSVEEALAKHQQELKGTLEALEEIARHKTEAEGALPKLMNALITRNYYTGCSIYTLAGDFHNGPAAFDLARQMIEDMVNLEWMMVNNPDKQAKKFDAFVAIDRMNSMKEAELINLDLGSILTRKELVDIEKGDKEARSQLKIRESEDRRSYNMKNFEQMVADIRDKISDSNLDEPSLDRILWYYIQGNRKNHTSPNELLGYLQPENDVVLSLKGDMQYALYIAHAVLFTIGLRYTVRLLELNSENDLAKATQSKLIEQHLSNA